MLTLSAALAASPGLARRHSDACRSVHLSVARHSVHAGASVTVKGHVCRSKQKHRRIAIGVRTSRHAFTVKAPVYPSGKFHRKIHVGRAWKVGNVHIRAKSQKAHSRPVTVKVSPSLTSAANQGAPTVGGCELTNSAEQQVGMTLPGCNVIYNDTGAETSPTGLWGRLQCVTGSRYNWSAEGGDGHLTATGAAQANSAFRQMTVQDGDDFWGERCELGEDDWRTGPTAVYHEGDHYVTYISELLPSNFPLSTKSWQTVMQMKQTQPGNGGGEAPQIEMEAREGKWVIGDDWTELWTFPAAQNIWTRFAWNVYYSRSPSQGWMQVSADLNGDGDFDDPGERSPVFHAATLKTEMAGAINDPGQAVVGAAMTSHLRAGIYHDPSIPCPGGCSVQVDNVQIVGE
jgi:hypothetical protein